MIKGDQRFAILHGRSTLDYLLTSTIVSVIICPILLMEKMSDVLLLWKLLNTEKLRNKSKTTVFRRIDFADDEWRVAERYQP